MAKKSPRDKLISMMYLVLTAMLALQVSSTILEKFVLIGRSIQKANIYQIKENDELIKRVERQVAQSGNRAADTELLNKLISIREKTDEIVGYIEGLKLELLKRSGNKKKRRGKKGRKKLKGMKNSAVVGRLMINERKGKELKTLLNNYIKFLNSETGKNYSSIALDARDIDFLREDPNAGKKDFVNLNFYKTPLAVALATLTQFASDVIYKEADALATLSRKLGAQDYKVDTLVPVIIPKSNIIASGDTFEADVVLSAYSSSTPMNIIANGTKIPVIDGMGKIKIPATMSQGKIGPDKKNIKVDIEIKNQIGESTVVSKDFEYFVVKPVIRVDAGNVARLYRRCKNPLNITVPALGKNYKPKFTATGAQVSTEGGGKIVIIPTENVVSLNVYQDKILLGTETFRVRNVPLPTITLFSRGKELNEKRGIKAPGPRSINISVLADEAFKELLPEESRYKVSKGTVFLARGERQIDRVNIDSRDVNLNKLAAEARPGDRLVIEITEVLRASSFGGIEKVKMGAMIKTIPLT